MIRPAHVFRFLVALATVVFAIVPAAKSQASEFAPIDLPQMVRRSSAIGIARVASRNARWGDASRRWILTDYNVVVGDTVLSDTDFRSGSRTVLTFWGGAIGNEQQMIADIPHPEVDGDYLVFLRKDRNEPGLASPAVGGPLGIVRIDRGSNSVPIARLGLAGLSEAGIKADAAGRVQINNLLRGLRRKLSSFRRLPLEPFTGLLNSATGSPVLECKKLSHGPPVLPAAIAEPVTMHPAGIEASPESGTIGVQSNPFPWTARLPIVVNQFPQGWKYAGEDQAQMVKWNHYADVFRVYTQPTGTFAWRNGSFDMAGWVDDATMTQVYGFSWSQNPNTIAVTPIYYQNGWIQEADIAFNPAFITVLDDEGIYNGSSVYSFRFVMLHELGHMWGLNHEGLRLSVMNAGAPGRFQAYSFPYSDDAAAIRAKYPFQAQARTDFSLHLFRWGQNGWLPASHTTNIAAGDVFDVHDHHIENPGTTYLSAPKASWYLTTPGNAGSPGFFLGDRTYQALQSGEERVASTTGLKVPDSTFAGDYYVSAFVRQDEGPTQPSFPFSNNVARSVQRITVWPRLADLSLIPNPVVGGADGKGTLYLNTEPHRDMVVSLRSQSPLVLVPSTITVPKGAKSAVFTYATWQVSSRTSVTVTAQAAGSPLTVALTLDPAYTISGKVTYQGQGLNGVTVFAGGRSATTQSDGSYAVTLLPAGTHQVLPALAGYGFTPSSRSVTVGPDSPGNNFSAFVVPLAPTSMRAVGLDSSTVRVVWQDNSANEEGFLIERQIVGYTGWVEIARTGANATSWTNNVSNETEFRYRVAAFNSAGNSPYSNEQPIILMAQPDACWAVAVSSAAVKITWVDYTSYETKYDVFAATKTTPQYLVGTLSANAQTVTLTGLVVGERYTFFVRARNAQGKSSPSNSSSCTLLAGPRSLTATAASATQVRLKWQDLANGETSYQIERALGTGSFKRIAAIGANLTTYLDANATGKTAYRYRVRAANSEGVSSYSNTVSITTP